MSELQAKNNQELKSLEQTRNALTEHYKNEKKFVVMGAPSYQANFGSNMPIIINCIRICVPLDGKRYEIPESFACVFNERLNSVNEQIEQQKRLSNVRANMETFPGELDMIRPV